MKIGILTFHCAHNYGAVLQCYALQETLRQMGHEVEVIDYRPDYLVKPYKWFDIHWFISRNPINAARKFSKEIVLLLTRIKRYRAFEKFISSRLNVSDRVNFDSIPSKYDIYIMGSDQIWNPYITHGFEPAYFGKFKFSKEKRKYIAYAASMETKSLGEKAQNFYKQTLKNFDAVSVREFQLATLLQPLTDKKIETVLDPTLLADSSIWNKIAKRPKINQKYVLVYQVRGEKQNILSVANKIACQLNAVVVEVTSWFSIQFKRIKIQNAAPEEFLGLIKYASFVVTTSFHGTAFSVIFNRPFYCIRLDDGCDTRSMSLLKNIGLENRMITKDLNPVPSGIDYVEANKRVADLRKMSMNFLIKNIGE